MVFLVSYSPYHSIIPMFLNTVLLNHLFSGKCLSLYMCLYGICVTFDFSSTEVRRIPEWEARVLYGEVPDNKSMKIMISIMAAYF